MTPGDSLSLLLSLPEARLCQMLCLLSRQHDIETAWACLVWIESERRLRPPLSRQTRERWRQALFPSNSLDRLLNQNQPFDPVVLGLVTDTVFGLLFTATGHGPGSEVLGATLNGWDTKRDHLVLSFTSFLESLPGSAARELLDLPGSEFLIVTLQMDKRPPDHQRTALLLQVLLHLFYSGALDESALLQLYRFEGALKRKDWRKILDGLKSFPLALQARRQRD